MQPPTKIVHSRCGTVAFVVLLASCASVTRTSSLDSEPGRNWIKETGNAKIVVESVSGVNTSGRLVDAVAGVVRLQGSDSVPMTIPVPPGTNLRDPRRGVGALLGATAGVGVGVILGLVLTDALGTPNPDSAGGIEHPPSAVVVPLSTLVVMSVGAITGYALGLERRLELRSAAPPRTLAHHESRAARGSPDPPAGCAGCSAGEGW